jgi:AcrR family transcriptional regulator
VEREVKPRRYRSEHRREQAEQTRERVLDAARALFQELGWEGTSIAAIAKRAGVSQETIYSRFQNKRSLLGELVRLAVRGADPRPIPEQEGPRALMSATDQGRQIELFAEDIVLRLERAAPLVVVVTEAARSEPELAALHTGLHSDRTRNLRVFVDALARNGAIRLPLDEAVETVWALTSPELHQLLMRTRGWNRGRYRAWLIDSFWRLLLP